MPFAPQTPSPPPAPASADALPLRGLTLLAVEDSRFACDALRLICIRSGARLRRAETLAAARAYLASRNPDAVIVDLGLPDGRGEALIAELAARGVPVLGTSGDPDGRAAALAAGARGFLDKPVASISGFQRLILGLVGLAAPPPGSDVRTEGLPAADQLAFRDDLARAAALITAAGGGSYVTAFLRGLGRAAGDPALEEAARAASTGEGATALARLLTSRLEQPHGLS